MKALLISTLIILNAQTLMAETLMTCKGQSFFLTAEEENKTNEPVLHEVNLSLEKEGDNLSIGIDKKKEKVVEVTAVNLSITPELLTCAGGECLQKHFPQMSSEEIAIPGAVLMLAGAKAAGLPQVLTIDAKKITNAKMYHLAKPTKFGGWGLIELFDKNQKVLGRLFSALEVFECK